MRPWRYVPLPERGCENGRRRLCLAVADRFLGGDSLVALADDYTAFPDEVEATVRIGLLLREEEATQAADRAVDAASMY